MDVTVVTAQGTMELLVKCSNGDLTPIFVESQVLTAASPVFARIVEGGWKESSEGKIVVEGFGVDQVREFVECLKQEHKYVFTVDKVNAILPLVRYYQATCVVDWIIKHVRQLELTMPDVSTGTSCYQLMTHCCILEAFNIIVAVEREMVDRDLDFEWPRIFYRIFFYYLTERSNVMLKRLVGRASMECLKQISPSCLRKILYFVEVEVYSSSTASTASTTPIVVSDFCGLKQERFNLSPSP